MERLRNALFNLLISLIANISAMSSCHLREKFFPVALVILPRGTSKSSCGNSTSRYKLRDKEKIKNSLLVKYQLGKFCMQVLPPKHTSDLELPSATLALVAVTLKTVLRGQKH